MAAAEHRHRPWRLFIGRSPHSDLVLSDRTVSRVHAAVCREEDRWTITDLDSANGTYVNGTRVRAPTRIQDSDVLRIGRIQLKLAWPGEPGQAMATRERPAPPLGRGTRPVRYIPATVLALLTLGSCAAPGKN